MSLVFACIAPRGGLAIEELCAPEDRGKPDSYRQGLMLLGAVRGHGWRGELLSYEAPTYFGMRRAAYSGGT